MNLFRSTSYNKGKNTCGIIRHLRTLNYVSKQSVDEDFTGLSTMFIVG